jgi:hypothetical protein
MGAELEHTCRNMHVKLYCGKLDDIRAELEHTPRQSLKRLAQELGMPMSSVTQHLVRLKPCKSAVIHALQLRDPVTGVHFCCWFLQLFIEDEIDLQLIFFFEKAWL